jgi:glutamate racemase
VAEAPLGQEQGTVSDPRPIGVFDSGVGGLTVVAALRRALPNESLLYLGDTARLPYGTKSPATVVRYTERNVAFLLSRGVKAVVVACNTASALALDSLHPAVPVWGVIEPGAELAARSSTGRVGVIATEATVSSDAYPRALRARRADLAILSQACPLFVPLVEEGWADDPVAKLVAERYLAPLLAARIDTLILGCTHYPLLRSTLEQVLGSEVGLVDSAAAVAARVAADLAAAGLLAPAPGATVEHHVCVTDAGTRFARLARQILGAETPLELVEVGMP